MKNIVGILVAMLILTVLPQVSEASSCEVIDFEAYPNGSAVVAGDLLQTAFQPSITGIMGFNEDGAMQVVAFDTTYPTCGDAEMGALDRGMVMVTQDQYDSCVPNTQEDTHEMRIISPMNSSNHPSEIVIYAASGTVVVELVNDFSVVYTQMAPSEVLASVSLPVMDSDWVSVRSDGEFAIDTLTWCTQEPTSVGLSEFGESESGSLHVWLVFGLLTLAIALLLLSTRVKR